MSGLLKKISEFFSSPPGGPEFLEYRIECGKCGEVITIKVFPDRDLNPTYEDNGPAYVLKKEVMDSECFRMIQIEICYDSARREISREITGGIFVD